MHYAVRKVLRKNSSKLHLDGVSCVEQDEVRLARKSIVAISITFSGPMPSRFRVVAQLISDKYWSGTDPTLPKREPWPKWEH